mmetsp:Transcript_42189/g.72677  ORF Transcript_42189/g.72677 Transcript_42189/m.72677 type:complete len:122 (-) Transcript_42189:403-768(-)|eukprot:CAMPEP_0194583660 /NCGR_PEP_ID=MMETSP0292-20121207/16494_1 /TAXON_ID=39354 /ORGANISM="Heterosigma akashiwo, Strain CCMP2393" /LENGTH=121 /DNA_ID=CAMNT_0039438369 /DNA_START=141 /DNA_END=509 /DNA_ORIENTATION=+
MSLFNAAALRIPLARRAARPQVVLSGVAGLCKPRCTFRYLGTTTEGSEKRARWFSNEVPYSEIKKGAESLERQATVVLFFTTSVILFGFVTKMMADEDASPSKKTGSNARKMLWLDIGPKI